MIRPDPNCTMCYGTGTEHTSWDDSDPPCSCLHEGLTDAELIALAALVQTHAIQMQVIEDYRRACGVNDAGVQEYAHGAQELQAELHRRGVL